MHYKVLRAVSAAIIGFLMLLGAGGAHAALVNFSVTGVIDGSDVPGPYGLGVGDIVTASGSFEDSAISTSPYTVYFDLSHPGNTMSIAAGSLSLDETQDANYSAGGSPRLEFDSGGNLIGVNFYWGAVDGSSFDSGVLGFIVNDPNYLATGSWNASSFTTTPVPVPAAMWLFGSGLLGLAGAIRRRKNS